LKVEFFEKTGGANVILKWKGPDSGNKWEVVPKASLMTKGGNLNYEEKAVYQCKPGFTTGGEFNAPTTFNVECLPTGELSAPQADSQCRNVDDCEQHTCGPKGQCVDLVGPAPAYTCNCDFGFEIQVAANGEKRCGNKDDCEGKDCGVGVCKDLIGDYTCQCPSGHYIGVVNGDKTCIPVQCEADTPSIRNGRMLSSHSGAVSFPTTLRYKCDVGYSVDGSVSESKRKFQGQCKSDGQLTGMMSCQKITCGTPHVVPFTRLTSPGSPRRSIEYDDKAKYECINGYTLGGRPGATTKFEVQCKDDGVLTDPKVCEPVRCGAAPRVAKARPGISGSVSFGQALVYRCDLGYTSDGSLQGSTEFGRQCKVDGQFTDLVAAIPCRPIAAGRSPTIGNADLKEYGGSRASGTVSAFYPNSIEYRCRTGHSTNGAPSGPTKISARVNSIGQFSPALPTECKLITYTIRGRVKNARNGWMLSGMRVSVEGTNIATNSAYGAFTLRGVPAGSARLVYSKSGFITNRKTLTVTADINSGGVADVSTSPAMQNDQYRAVVKWGRSPSDLDSYAQWGWSKVCWYGSRRYASGITGVLEQDKTAGYGPETVYLSGVGRCRGNSYMCDIKYMVNDYTRSGSMLRRGQTEVTLYTGSRVAGVWKIQDCPRSVIGGGNWWHVFTIDGRTNRLKWSCNQGALLQTGNGTAYRTNSTMDNAAIEDMAMNLPVVEKPSLKVRRIS